MGTLTYLQAFSMYTDQMIFINHGKKERVINYWYIVQTKLNRQSTEKTGNSFWKLPFYQQCLRWCIFQSLFSITGTPLYLRLMILWKIANIKITKLFQTIDINILSIFMSCTKAFRGISKPRIFKNLQISKAHILRSACNNLIKSKTKYLRISVKIALWI